MFPMKRVIFVGKTAEQTLNEQITLNMHCGDKYKIASLKMLKLANKLFRHRFTREMEKQDTRGSNIDLRKIQIRPYLFKWKLEDTRKLWFMLTRKLVSKKYMMNIGLNSGDKTEDRVEKAVTYFLSKNIINNTLFDGVFDTKPLESLKVFGNGYNLDKKFGALDSDTKDKGTSMDVRSKEVDTNNNCEGKSESSVLKDLRISQEEIVEKLNAEQAKQKFKISININKTNLLTLLVIVLVIILVVLLYIALN